MNQIGIFGEIEAQLKNKFEHSSGAVLIPPVYLDDGILIITAKHHNYFFYDGIIIDIAVALCRKELIKKVDFRKVDFLFYCDDKKYIYSIERGQLLKYLEQHLSDLELIKTIETR
jgi:hypothetical protein